MEIKSKSFTIIEILVIITIICLFFGTGLAYYINFNEQKKLDEQVQKIDDILYLVQQKAIAGDIYTTCSSGNFSGYKVNFTATNIYKTYFCCGENCATPILMNSFTLDSPLIHNLPNIIYFKPLIGNISSTTTINVKITNPNTTKCSQITIEPSGLMSLISPCP